MLIALSCEFRVERRQQHVPGVKLQSDNFRNRKQRLKVNVIPSSDTASDIAIGRDRSAQVFDSLSRSAITLHNLPVNYCSGIHSVALVQVCGRRCWGVVRMSFYSEEATINNQDKQANTQRTPYDSERSA